MAPLRIGLLVIGTFLASPAAAFADWRIAFLLPDTTTAVPRLPPSAPTAASPSWFIAAGIGLSKSGSFTGAKRTYTGQLGKVSSAGRFGFDLDFGFAVAIRPGVSMRTLTGSLLIFPIQGAWRPYASVGGGIMGAAAKVSQVFNPFSSAAPSDPGLTFGGGVMGELTPRFGRSSCCSVRLAPAIRKLVASSSPPRIRRIMSSSC